MPSDNRIETILTSRADEKSFAASGRKGINAAVKEMNSAIKHDVKAPDFSAAKIKLPNSLSKLRSLAKGLELNSKQLATAAMNPALSKWTEAQRKEITGLQEQKKLYDQIIAKIRLKEKENARVSEARRLAKVRKGNAEEIARIRQANELETYKAKLALRAQARELDNTAKTTKKMGGIVGRVAGIFQRFGKVLAFRLYRMAAMKVLQAAAEGLKLLVEWDRTYGNNTSHAAKTVDELSGKWRQVKKAAGAAIMPIIQLFQPALMALMDAVVKIFEFIQQIARSFQGYKTYMKAVYRETEHTTKAAKELQRVLFGFDELNVLPSQTGAADNSDVGRWEYKEVPIDNRFLNGIADLTNYIRDLIGENETLQGIFDGILGTLLALGGIAVLEGLKKLGKALKDVGKYASEAWGHAKDLWAKLSEKIMVNVVFPAKEAIVKAANEVYGWAKEALTKSFITIRTVVASATAKAVAVYNAAAKWLSLKWLTIKTVVQSATLKVEAVFKAAQAWLALRWLTIKTVVQSATLKIAAVFNAVKLWLASRVVTIKTAVASATTRAAIVWAKAKAVLSVPITIPVIVGVGALALLPTLISSLQTLANANPVSVPITLGTTGLASALSSLWTSIQKFWNDNVITVRFKAGTETTPKASTTPNKAAQLWAESKAEVKSSSATSLPNPYANMSATDLVNYAESTGLNLTQQDRAVGGLVAGTIATGFLAPAALATGATAGGLANMASALKYLSPLLGFAGGGSIPNKGSLILAGEAGPEIVANMGSRTGVMNVNQMEAALANSNEGVISALYSVANEVVRAVNNKNFDVYMDASKVGQSVTTYQNNQTRRTGVPQLV